MLSNFKIPIGLSVILLFVATASFAEDVISPDVNGLFDAPVIFTGKGVLDSSTGKVRFTIQHVLKNTSDEVLYFGGTFDFYQPTSCGFGLGASEIDHKNLIVYLRKFNGKWFVHGGTQHFRKLVNGKIPFELCRKTYYYSVEEFKRLKAHFFLTFEQKGEFDFTSIMPKEVYNNSFSPFESILNFYACIENDNFPYPNEELPVPDPIVNVADTTIYKITEVNPEFPGGIEEMMKYISERIPDSLNKIECSIRGNVYVQFVVEKDGSLTQYKVLRGVESRLDKAAIEIVKTMPKWTPAQQRGKSVRCYYILPVRFPNM